ncbi:phosphotransferase family protein [Herbidospora sp. RD11066]
MGRSVSARVTCGDEDFGEFGPVEMPSPWWNDVGPVAAWLHDLFGVPVVVLRLVDVEGGRFMRDGHVTYHAEALEPPAKTPTHLAFRGSSPASPEVPRGEPLRASWATVEGLRAALDWALAITGPSEIRQVKTWNLAGLFHLPAAGAWLKTTPPFAAPEPAVIAALAAVDPTLVPHVLGADPDRGWMLLEHIPGEDCWKAGPELVTTTVRRFAQAQQKMINEQAATPGREQATASPLADRRRILAAAERLAPIPGSDELLTEIDALEEELAACGIPYTLVHGDFHPGNWRAVPGGHAVVLDFADAHFGHPATDGLRLQEWVGNADAWVEAWSIPGADPRRALEVAAPLAALTQAVRYQEFLDNIEPSERRYHLGDPEEALENAVTAFRRLRRA